MPPNLTTTYQRWLNANPRDTYIDSIPVGYKRCGNQPVCIALIAEQQERDFCYSCGGRPNVPRRPLHTKGRVPKVRSA